MNVFRIGLVSASLAACITLAGCAGLQPQHEACVGPPSYCDVYIH